MRRVQITLLILTIPITWIVLWGFEYYRLPLAERTFDSRHTLLGPSGTLGLTCGVVALLLMIVNLAYLIRKLMIRSRWLGSPVKWLKLHVVTGLVAAGFALVHSAFLPTSTIGILATLVLFVVIVAGIVGRYFYLLVPRNIDGGPLTRAELHAQLQALRKRLGPIGNYLPEELSDQPVRGFWSALWVVLTGDKEAKARFKEIGEAIERGDPQHWPIWQPVLAEVAKRNVAFNRYRDLHVVMSCWRFAHRWLALLLMLLIVAHVTLAYLYGDLWIFGGEL